MVPRAVIAAVFLAGLVPFIPLVAPAQPPEPRVTRFSPQGIQKRVRQVQAVFSRPMVPVGDPRPGADPFEITCPERGAGRWLDALTWVYDFDRELPGGIRCSFRLSAGLRALDGGAVGGPREFAFSTGGPAIRSSTPHPERGLIDEEQAFVLVLDARVTEDSVLQKAGFSVEGLRERVGVRILTGAVRDTILTARYGDTSRPEHLLVLQARQRFPNGRRVTLVWGRGVEAASGVATDQDQELTWVVRPAFTIDFRCGRESPRSACVPVMPMTIEFSAPLAAAEARRIGLVAPDGRRLAPEGRPDDEGPLLSRLTFKGPFPENATLQVQVPDGLSDEAGRRPVNAASYPLAVRTGPFPPLAKFSARFGVLERNADPALPVTVRNLEPEVAARLLGVPAGSDGFLEWVQGRLFRVPLDRAGDVLPWLQRLAAADRERSVFGPPASPERAGRAPEGAKTPEGAPRPPEGARPTGPPDQDLQDPAAPGGGGHGGHRHSAPAAWLLRGRAGERPTRRRSARPEPAHVRPGRGAGDEPRRPPQARDVGLACLGDHPRRGAAGGGSAGGRARLPRPGAVARAHRGRRDRAPRRPARRRGPAPVRGALQRGPRQPRRRAVRDRADRRRHELRPLELVARHRALALQPAHLRR